MTPDAGILVLGIAGAVMFVPMLVVAAVLENADRLRRWWRSRHITLMREDDDLVITVRRPPSGKAW